MGTFGRWIIRALTLGACLGWIGALAWLLLDGRYLHFLAPAYRGLLVAGGVVLAAFAAAVALRGLPGPRGAGSPRAAWLPVAICLVPLAFLVVNTHPKPSAFSLEVQTKLDYLWRSQDALGLADLPRPPADANTHPARRAAPSSRPAGAAPAPANSPEQLDIMDLFIRYPKNIGRSVEVIGVVCRQPDLPPGTFAAFRYLITCCADDSRPVAVLVTRAEGVGEPPPANTWVRLRGTVARTNVRGLDMPMLKAQQVTPIPAPANPYTD
jgi:uncharacterized repeat protein (TIGR03943 family)